MSHFKPASRPTSRKELFPFQPLTLLLGVSLFVGPLPGLLHAQETDRTPATHDSGVSLPGSPIPVQLEGLEEAHTAYLTAWHGEDPWMVMSFLNPAATGLTRSGIVAAPALETLVNAAVPHLRIHTASLYLVEETDGWVTVGTYLQILDEDHEPKAASKLTVWERGSDLQWRVVFLTALWMDMQETVASRNMSGPTTQF